MLFFRATINRLESWFEQEIELAKIPKGSKTPLKAQLEQVYKATGKKPQQLAELQDPPDELLYVWRWWKDLRKLDRLTFAEIESWSRLMRIDVSPWEVDLIMSLDFIYERAVMRNG